MQVREKKYLLYIALLLLIKLINFFRCPYDYYFNDDPLCGNGLSIFIFLEIFFIYRLIFLLQVPQKEYNISCVQNKECRGSKSFSCQSEKCGQVYLFFLILN